MGSDLNSGSGDGSDSINTNEILLASFYFTLWDCFFGTSGLGVHVFFLTVFSRGCTVGSLWTWGVHFAGCFGPIGSS
jgi:hypothetical protein